MGMGDALARGYAAGSAGRRTLPPIDISRLMPVGRAPAARAPAARRAVGGGRTMMGAPVVDEAAEERKRKKMELFEQQQTHQQDMDRQEMDAQFAQNQIQIDANKATARTADETTRRANEELGMKKADHKRMEGYYMVLQGLQGRDNTMMQEGWKMMAPPSQDIKTTKSKDGTINMSNSVAIPQFSFNEDKTIDVGNGDTTIKLASTKELMDMMLIHLAPVNEKEIAAKGKTAVKDNRSPWEKKVDYTAKHKKLTKAEAIDMVNDEATLRERLKGFNSFIEANYSPDKKVMAETIKFASKKFGIKGRGEDKKDEKDGEDRPPLDSFETNNDNSGNDKKKKKKKKKSGGDGGGASGS